MTLDAFWRTCPQGATGYLMTPRVCVWFVMGPNDTPITHDTVRHLDRCYEAWCLGAKTSYHWMRPYGHAEGTVRKFAHPAEATMSMLMAGHVVEGDTSSGTLAWCRLVSRRGLEYWLPAHAAAGDWFMLKCSEIVATSACGNTRVVETVPTELVRYKAEKKGASRA